MNPPSPSGRASAERPSDEVVVRATGLTKVFKDFWGRPKARAVDNVDFEIRRGEVFGLLGPNGSGKSTTIKLLLGLLYPTKGHITVFGQSPRDVATKSRIGYLPEESYLYRFLNPAETLDFFGSLFQIDSAERRRRAEQLIEMVGLNQARSRTVGEFSKGMQRRIGIAQALINDPDLVILDEPTAGLDPLGCREVKDLILALAQRGKTVILSSHLLSDVEDVCDRAVIYYGGRIQAQGPLHQLLAKPDSGRQVVDRVELQTLMWDDVGLARTGERLETTLARLQSWRPTQKKHRFFPDWEDASLLALAHAVTAAATARHESRGAHYRLDDPAPKSEMARPIIVKRKIS
jgi:ABC-2 type transport system ATP-binding protein